MAHVSVTTPLLFQSKVFCLSLYFLTTLPLSLYVSFSQSDCTFHSPPRLTKARLFSLPPSYGEHKYALPSIRSGCSSVSFSEYGKAMEEIQYLCRISSAAASTSPVLTYLHGEGASFAGNFLKKFPVRISDKLAIEKCDGVVLISAIFSNHDQIRQPKNPATHTLQFVYFFMFIDGATLRDLVAHSILSSTEEKVDMIGVWRIVRLVTSELPYDNAVMNGVIQSIWCTGSSPIPNSVCVWMRGFSS